MTVSIAAEMSGRFRRMRARELGAEADFARQDFRVGRHEQDVVESEGFLENAQHGVTRAEGSATFYPARAVRVKLVCGRAGAACRRGRGS